MAASTSRLGYLALRYTYRTPSRKKAPPPIVPFRQFHTTRTYRQDDNAEPPPEKKPFDFLSSLDDDGRNHYNLLSPEEKIRMEEVARKLDAYMTSPQVESDLTGETSQAAYDISAGEDKFEMPSELDPKIKPGLMAMGELDPQAVGEDEEFMGDDISSLAHGELEQHREMREYARIAAWEMPLLTSVFLSIRSWVRTLRS